jgi:hypothetical protein
MVWDRQEKGPARYGGQTAIGLARDDALAIKEQLTKHYIARG